MGKNSTIFNSAKQSGAPEGKLPPAYPNLALCPNCFAENKGVNFSRTQIRRAWLVMYAFDI